MDDRELMMLAARAAGLDYSTTDGMDRLLVRGPDRLRRPWDPLTNDGDAFGLARKLCLTVDFNEGTVRNPRGELIAVGKMDIRRAITRAAAEIGKKVGAPLTRAD
ncbi:UNVERIFIED_ORG: hypothetical protein ABIC54_004522 [Burkholderia sp. 1263]